MYLAYVDESGDKGPEGSKTFVLACVLVSDSAWLSTLDALLTFRRALRKRVGLGVTAEVKANYLLRNGGPFHDLALNERSRRKIYREHLQQIEAAKLKVFAVMVKKEGITSDPREIAWDRLMQRLERFCHYNRCHLGMVHDEGDAGLARKAFRRARRAGIAGMMFGSGSLDVPAKLFVDDPSARRSQDSYFLQLADLCAYAAYRRHYPPPSGPHAPIVPQLMWEALGKGILREANKNQGGQPPGIVVS